MSFIKCICHDDIASQNTAAFLKSAQELKNSLDSIASKQKALAICFYSRDAQISNISTQYTQWKEQLAALAAQIEECRIRITKGFEQLPLLDDSEASIPAWKLLGELKQIAYRKRKTNKKLALFLNSPEHQKTLKLCKETIQECEKQKDPSKIALSDLIDNVEALIIDQHEKMGNMDKKLCKSIQSIHEETLRFLLYVANAAKQNTQRITELLESPEELQNSESEPFANEKNSYINSFKNAPLDTNRYFKQGMYLVNVRYPAIYETLEKMHLTAKGLQLIETNIETQIKQAWQGAYTATFTGDLQQEIPFFRSCLKKLKLDLTEQRNELYDTAFSTQVHAGLHYAASLFDWIDDIEENITFLSKITQNTHLLIGKVQRLLYSILSEPTLSRCTDTDTSYAAIHELHVTLQTLYEIAHSKSQSSFFEEHRSRIATAVTSSLSHVGHGLFILTDAEKEVEKTVLERKSLTKGSETALEALLLKKILRHLHFTDDAFDLSLDLLLTTLETQGKYKEIFKKMQEASEFALLVWSYRQQSAFAQVGHILFKLCDVAFLMNRATLLISNIKSERYAYAFGLYAQCQQLLCEVESTSASTQSKSRLASLLELIKPQVSEIQRLHGFPKHYSDLSSVVIPEKSEVATSLDFRVMYKLAAQALWATDVHEQEEARTIIDSIAPRMAYNCLSDNNKYLLKRLALDRYLSFHEGDCLSATEEAYLPYVFEQHFAFPSFWEHQFNMGEIENGLYNLLDIWKSEKITGHEAFQATYETWRSKLLGLWKLLVVSYRNCKYEMPSPLNKERFVLQIKKIEESPIVNLNDQFRYVLKRLREDVEQDIEQGNVQDITQGVQDLSLST
ncbi:MAG: hypothetical protein JSR46_04670 [Verrucomicrobia bacterium]|nr:hypothetical protein [Verrucomicrobiota bacterium]